MRSMVVEDHKSVAELLAWRLGQVGHGVTAVALAAEALDLAGRERFDLVILDLSLPDSPVSDTIPRFMIALRAIPIVAA
jgi:DNA-binding response OmpR family regulator